MSEAGSFASADSVNVIIIEDGVHRLVSSQVGNDFGDLVITNEACTASVSLQVLIHVRTSGFTDVVDLDEVSITGTSAFADIDLDGVDDAADGCIDIDGDGTCDGSDAQIMLMDEDFSSYSVGTGIGSYDDDEAGIAHVEGVTGAGQPGWALIGEVQRVGVSVQSSGGYSYLKYKRTGIGTTDTNNVTLMTRCFDLSRITSPKVRFEASEISDFLTWDPEDVAGGFVVTLIEDGVEREVLHVHGEFTSVDSTITSNAQSQLSIVVRGYAAWKSEIHLDRLSVMGTYCPQGGILCTGDVSFEFSPTPSSGTLLGQVSIDGIPASSEDWIAGFDEQGQCVGAAQLIMDNGIAYAQLPLYGDDETTALVDEGMDEGEGFTLKLFDASEDTILTWVSDAGETLLAGWTNTNGAPLPGYADSNTVYLFADFIPGCTDFAACNYDSEATVDDGSCLYFDALGVCGGSCAADADGDGICDDIDPCVGTLDALGLCNGGCAADADADGICDSEDDCLGEEDLCGVCNGPGAILQCGCSNIPESDCDCDGNQLDALGVCGGTCASDLNGNGICDDLEATLCGLGSFYSPELGQCLGLDGTCPTDLDGNGSTGSADLLILLSNYDLFCID